MELKVMTYNIMGGCRNVNPRVKDYDAASGVIRDFSPDIVCLNEVGKHLPSGISSHAGYLAERTGMNFFFAPAIDVEGFPYGNALLSKYPIVNPRKVMIPDPPVKDEKAYYETRCIIVADIDVGDGITVIASHFGLAKSERRLAVETVLSELDAAKKPVILMGDFNSSPDSVFMSPLYEVLDEVDRLTNANLFTFPSDAPNSKIDYIFVSRGIRAETVFSPVTLASDHCPLCAKLTV